jgi:hypothetical protein
VRRKTMNIRKAIGIFCNINNDKYALLEKGEAIYEVLQMPTHMSITKDDMLQVIDWLWNIVFEFGSKEPTDEEIISQIEDIIRDRKSFLEGNEEHDKIYLKDIEALERAIEELRAGSER